jgi:mono/diheme cytochrome c family protein
MRLPALAVGLVFLCGAAQPARLTAQVSGEAVFRQKCVGCHYLGSDRLVGPGLAGVTTRRDPAWLKQFIMYPDRLLASGDSIAVALVEEYQLPMPNLATTDAEAEALIAYLATAGSAVGSGTPPAILPATEEQILLGQDLFQGRRRLANGGPTCNSCHEVTNDAVIGGGILARELTTVFSRLGGPGVRAILGSPPFPVMQRAYEGKGLTEAEVTALLGFLQRADAERELHQPRDYGIQLFGAGVVGTVLLLGLYSLLWRNRLKGSVNQTIYDRQISST